MDYVIARQAGAAFEALMLEQMLAPLQASFGEFGDVVVNACARSIAQSDAGGFASLVTRALEQNHA